jgi:hypothetical protein
MEKNNIEMMECIKCSKPMPKLRFTLYGYKVCVNCSTVGTYKALTTVNGEGDHTWNDITILTDEQYTKYQQYEKETAKKKK